MSLGVGDDARAEQQQVQAELRAMAHPIRLRILSLLTGAAMTAAEIARELDLTHANASYHVRQLAEVGQIEVVAEERIRGGVAKRYRYVLDDRAKPRGWADPSQIPYRQALYDAMAIELKRRARYLRATPKRSHMTDAELWVTPEVWAEIRTRVQDASDDLHRAAQPVRAAGTIRVNASIAMFEMEPQP